MTEAMVDDETTARQILDSLADDKDCIAAQVEEHPDLGVGSGPATTIARAERDRRLVWRVIIADPVDTF